MREGRGRWRGRVVGAKTKKANKASGAALRTPSPPSLTGNDAWSHWVSSREQLTTVPAQSSGVHRNSPANDGLSRESSEGCSTFAKSQRMTAGESRRSEMAIFAAYRQPYGVPRIVLPMHRPKLSLETEGHPKAGTPRRPL